MGNNKLGICDDLSNKRSFLLVSYCHLIYHDTPIVHSSTPWNVTSFLSTKIFTPRNIYLTISDHKIFTLTLPLATLVTNIV